MRKSGRTPDDVERAVGSVGQETLSATADRLRVVSVPAGIDVASFTRKLQAQPQVAEVTPLHRRRLLAKAATAVSDPAFNTPDDQWYSIATGANYAWSYNPGTGAKIAVIDTGIDETNTDLTRQVVYQEAAITPIDNSTCQGAAGAVPVVSVTDASMQDDNGHGTNVSGLALAKSDSVGFAGTAWGARLMAFRIFLPQNQYCNESKANLGADTADEARAITDAIAHGADVISLSIGSPSYDASISLHLVTTGYYLP
jgi:subtilisin family serine protease